MRLNGYNTPASAYTAHILNNEPPDSEFIRDFYRTLRAYYQMNGLYEYLNQELGSTHLAAMRPLRNPAWRVVEFYASKLWPGTLPGALPITTENEAIIEPIHQIWKWSNFSSAKQQWARTFAIYGDLFIRVQSRADVADNPLAVFMTIIDPIYVNSFELDERGYLTWIRIDIPRLDEREEEVTYTEVWDKSKQTFSWWNEHKLGVDAKLDRLGTPDGVKLFSEMHGEDFIPIVYQPFRDDGLGRGSGAFTAQLDKIDEVNRQATRLSQLLFRHNKAVWAATTAGVDAQGRPLPPPNFDNLVTDGALTLGDDSILILPTASDLKALVPPINYSDALQVLNSQVEELKQDLPELSYYELIGSGDLSGRAIKFMLDNMISRAQEARGNGESALIRAHQMALTIAQNLGIKGFDSLGSYEDGSFDHTFDNRPVLPKDITEIGQFIQLMVMSGATLKAAARLGGFSIEEADILDEGSTNINEVQEPTEFKSQPGEPMDRGDKIQPN